MPRLNVVLLESQSHFDVWLDDNYGLHDASVTAISPLPDGVSMPETVTVAFRLQIAGGYAAGDERTIRTITLTAHGIANSPSTRMAGIPTTALRESTFSTLLMALALKSTFLLHSSLPLTGLKSSLPPTRMKAYLNGLAIRSSMLSRPAKSAYAL